MAAGWSPFQLFVASASHVSQHVDRSLGQSPKVGEQVLMVSEWVGMQMVGVRGLKAGEQGLKASKGGQAGSDGEGARAGSDGEGGRAGPGGGGR